MRQGRTFSEASEEAGLLSPLYANSVKHAEQSGELGEALETIGEDYERRFDITHHGVLTLLEPIMIIVVGFLIGLIIIAAYLPLFSLPNAIR